MFVIKIARILAKLSSRQERLGSEFEAAMFSDIESLYEA